MNVEEIKILKSLAEPRTCTSSHLKIAVPRHLFDEKNKSLGEKNGDVLKDDDDVKKVRVVDMELERDTVTPHTKDETVTRKDEGCKIKKGSSWINPDALTKEEMLAGVKSVFGSDGCYKCDG